MLSIACLMMFVGAIATLIGVTVRNAADLRDYPSYRPEPRGAIDHAAGEALLSD